ncbi:MAG: FecR domain-containing protein [Bacteroidetes bacterium]|nr:FecR domain-containing protein [Bacteroidota bacterium]
MKKRDDSGKKASMTKEELEQAKLLLEHVSIKEHLPDAGKLEASLAAGMEAITAYEEQVSQRSARIRYIRRVWAAAAIAGITVVAAGLLYNKNTRALQPVEYATAFGDTHKMYLPDSSLVILNAHSSLRHNGFVKGRPREVWLEGEAYFKVRHLAGRPDAGAEEKEGAPYERFLVQTKELTVEVLGTAFDIRQRRGKTEIVLEEGSIRVSFKNASHIPLIMKPGDMLSFDPAAARLERSTTAPADYTGWTSGKLQLPNPGMPQIVQYLEDNYGYKVIIKDPALLTKSVEGPILFDNLDDVLFVLSKVLNADIVKKDSTLIFSPR